MSTHTQLTLRCRHACSHSLPLKKEKRKKKQKKKIVSTCILNTSRHVFTHKPKKEKWKKRKKNDLLTPKTKQVMFEVGRDTERSCGKGMQGFWPLILNSFLCGPQLAQIHTGPVSSRIHLHRAWVKAEISHCNDDLWANLFLGDIPANAQQ